MTPAAYRELRDRFETLCLEETGVPGRDAKLAGRRPVIHTPMRPMTREAGIRMYAAWQALTAEERAGLSRRGR